MKKSKNWLLERNFVTFSLVFLDADGAMENPFTVVRCRIECRFQNYLLVIVPIYRSLEIGAESGAKRNLGEMREN
jgi:hypothetical protein